MPAAAAMRTVSPPESSRERSVVVLGSSRVAASSEKRLPLLQYEHLQLPAQLFELAQSSHSFSHPVAACQWWPP